jgi:ribosome-associated protein
MGQLSTRPGPRSGEHYGVKSWAFALASQGAPDARLSAPTTSRPIAETSAKPDPAERSLQLALAAALTAEENRGEDIVVLDMRTITPVFDYFVIATGNSRRQLHAISEEIEHVLEDELRDKRMGIEGYDDSRWILLDYGNVVIHLFDRETREFYALEDFWSEAQRVPLPWQPTGESSGESEAKLAKLE